MRWWMWAVLGSVLWLTVVIGGAILILANIPESLDKSEARDLGRKVGGRMVDCSLWPTVAIWGLAYWYFGKYAGIPTASVIYCKARVLLVRRRYEYEWDIMTAFPDYVTFEGPWSEAEVVKHFADMRGTDDARWPFSRGAISSFFRSKQPMLEYQGHPFRPKNGADEVAGGEDRYPEPLS